MARESKLPGLSAWGRVKDYREYQLSQMPGVDIYFESHLTADEILEFGFENVALATGSTWRRDGVARSPCGAHAGRCRHGGLYPR